jgi:hypothetical protein
VDDDMRPPSSESSADSNTGQWFTIEGLRDHARALADTRRLEQAWPGRYEIRVVRLGDRFAISVRHRA